MSVKTYDPALIVGQWGGIIFSGYQDGEFIKASRDEDTFKKYVGTDGEVSRVRSRNKTGTVTLTLAQTSMANDEIAAQAEEDELTGLIVAPLTIKDLSGATLFFSPDAWVKKPAEVAYGKEIGPREWVFDCGSVEVFVGGSALVGGV